MRRCITLAAATFPSGPNPACPMSAPSYPVPGQYTYGNTFSATTGVTAIAWSSINGGSAGFIDDYLIKVAPAQVDALTATINLGGGFSIGNLFARLYSFASNPSGPVSTTPIGTVCNGVVSGSGGATTVQIGTAGTPVDLASGAYGLEISGTTTASMGGQYFGAINLSPVPASAALPLLLSGLGAIAALVRRRHASAVTHDPVVQEPSLPSV